MIDNEGGQRESAIRTSQVDGVALAQVDGKLDLKNSDKLLQILIKFQDEGKFRIVLDLSRVNFISSSGLGVISATLERLKEEGGSLKLAGMRDEIRKVFEILGMIEHFDIYEYPDEAIKAFISAEK